MLKLFDRSLSYLKISFIIIHLLKYFNIFLSYIGGCLVALFWCADCLTTYSLQVGYHRDVTTRCSRFAFIPLSSSCSYFLLLAHYVRNVAKRSI